MRVFEKTDTLQKAVLSCEGRFQGTALVCGDVSISYQEFDSVSEHIAFYLLSRGIGPGDVVALSMHRSEKMMSAVYGILKAGACLLPIPVNLPDKRKEMILGDTEISLNLTDEVYEKALREELMGEYVYRLACPEDEALILYTSGSSGKPKGVCHSQASMFLSKDQFPLHISESLMPGLLIETVIAKTNINFISAYMFEVLTAPLTGRKMVVLKEDEQNSRGAVGRAISANKNASVFITPSETVSFLKDKSFREDFKKLGTLVLAGEILKPEVREEILACAGEDTDVVNIYGSSECHVITAGNVREGDYPYTAVLPGVEARLINVEEPDGIRETGELAVSSLYLLSRYTNAVVRTVTIQGKTYFCTGDEAVLSETGKIWIKGRKDRMIKYHGLRIELGDIESNICKYPGIRECAVSVNRTDAGTEVLCAWYASDKGIAPGKIRDFLSAYLPRTIIPVGLTRLQELPLNPNGKIDYHGLSEKMFVPEIVGEKNYPAELATDNERLIASILKEIWEGANLSPSSNLFQIGMDSLTAFRLIGELRERGYTLGIAEIFDHPVLAEVAKRIQKREDGNLHKEDVSGNTLPATGVQIYWGTDITQEKKTHGLYVTNTFVCEMPYTEKSFQKRVELIVKKHPAFRAAIVFENERPKQVIAEDAVVKILYEDLRDMRKAQGDLYPFEPTGEQMALIRERRDGILEELFRNEELMNLQAACFRISDKTCVIICTGNHLSVDGSSMNVLMQELSLETIDEEQDHYLDFLRYIGKKSNIKEAADFWQDYLKDADFSALPKIEAENSEEAAEPSDFRSITISLTAEETKRLEEKSQVAGISTVGLIMYLYGEALMRILKKDALIFQILTFGRGVPVSGMDRSIGCFIEYVPIVIRKEGSLSDFRTGYLLAEQYSYLPAPILWKTALGLDKPPELAPFLISEIFPQFRTKGYFKELTERNYADMVMSNFVVMEDDHIALYFHFDAAKTAEGPFIQMTDELKRLIKEECRVGI